MENEPAKAHEKPEDEKHGEASGHDGHPETVIFHVSETDPDGDDGDKEDIGGEQSGKDEYGPESQLFPRQWLMRNHFVIL